MLKPKTIIKHHKHSKTSSILKKEFGLICWNIHKKNHTEAFKAYVNKMQKLYPSNLFLFQEANEPIDKEFILNDFETLFTANLQLKTKSYGILTACDSSHTDASCLLSQHQEFFFKTHKTTLISSYKLVNNLNLVVVNIHALNFKSAKIYGHEIAVLMDLLLEHKGPLILAGDFNTWNAKRNCILATMQEKLSLEKVIFKNDHYIKRFRQLPLDHVFYRGLRLNEAEAIDTNKLSDHNPLYASFTIN